MPYNVLFACGCNAIRSPTAEPILTNLLCHRICVDSTGAQPEGNEVDGSVIAVMQKIGLNIARYDLMGFEDMRDNLVDLILTCMP